MQEETKRRCACLLGQNSRALWLCKVSRDPCKVLVWYITHCLLSTEIAQIECEPNVCAHFNTQALKALMNLEDRASKRKEPARTRYEAEFFRLAERLSQLSGIPVENMLTSAIPAAAVSKHIREKSAVPASGYSCRTRTAHP